MDEILRTYKAAIRSLTLIPSHGGVFVVRRDGRVLFDKAAAGRFPHPGELVELLADVVD